MIFQTEWQKHARRRLFDKHEPTRMTRLDWLLMSAITLAYAVVAFINLGSFDIPQTFYTLNDSPVVVEFDSPQDISTIKYYTSLGEGNFTFSYSMDGEGYTDVTQEVTNTDEDGASSTTTTEPLEVEYQTTNMYEWQFVNVVPFTARYVMITSTSVGERPLRMLEMGFCGADGKPVAVKSATSTDPEAPRGNPPGNMFDEQKYVPLQTYYMNEMYFDEVYHARTALEDIEHLTPYEITHPPLGKIILSIGIRIFGMNPFGWRCMGTLFGVLMLPLMYLFAKRLFRKPLFAFIPTALFALDFMHYTQTRIATIDSYSVFFIMLMYYFMYQYTETNYNRQPLKKSLLPLALTGVAFGLGAATKWLCIYAGAGLAVILGIQMVKRYNEYRYARIALAEDRGLIMPPKPAGPIRRLLGLDRTEEASDSWTAEIVKEPAEDHPGMPPERRVFLEELCRSYLSKTFITLLWCVLFFIVVPLIIYVLSYIPYMQVTDNPYDFNGILQNQEYMFNYHSTLKPDHVHPFSSQWYLWPIDVRPVFYFQGQGYPDGYMSSMSTMGNPAIWWGGIGAVIALIVIRVRKGRLGQRTLFLSIAALSEYLPWILITRETFIYHYFATVPFLILLISVLAKYLIERTKHGKKAVFIYLGLCLVLFVMFYPVTTGTEVSRWYSDTFLRWLPSWPFY